jgi:hypothetical protein
VGIRTPKAQRSKVRKWEAEQKDLGRGRRKDPDTGKRKWMDPPPHTHTYRRRPLLPRGLEGLDRLPLHLPLHLHPLLSKRRFSTPPPLL